MGWLIDPDEACLFVYNRDRSVREYFVSDVILPVPEFAKGIELTLGEMWNWLQI